MEKYLEAADTALNVAIANGPSRRRRSGSATASRTRTRSRRRTENVYRLLDDGDVVCFSSSAWHNVGVSAVLSAGPRQLSLPHLRLRRSERRQAGHLSRDGRRHAADGQERPGRLLRRPARQADRGRVRRAHGAADHDSDPPLRTGAARTRSRRSAATSTRGRGWRCSGSRSKGRCTTPGRRRAIAASSATCRRRPAPIYNFRDRVEVVSKEPAGRCRADPRRLRAPGLSPGGDRRRRQAVRRPSSRPSWTASYTFEQAMRVGLKGVLVSPEFLFLREKPGQARRLRPGQPAVVLPVEHDARRGAAHARRAGEAEPAGRAPPAGRAHAQATRRRRPSPRTSSASGSACATSTPPSRATSSIPNSTTCSRCRWSGRRSCSSTKC